MPRLASSLQLTREPKLVSCSLGLFYGIIAAAWWSKIGKLGKIHNPALFPIKYSFNPHLHLAMDVQHPVLFDSRSHPGQQVSYLHLNPAAPHTLLFCYGAGNSSVLLNFYQSFLESHPQLSLLCVDRWTHGKDVARSGPQMLTDLTRITLELLDHLSISRFAIASHSAGVYQQLDLARHVGAERVTNMFLICSHIPTPYTGSKILKSLCTLPHPVFKTIVRTDASLGNTWIGKFVASVFTGEPNEQGPNALVVSKAHEKLIFKHIFNPKSHPERREERLDLDYDLTFVRIQDITNDTLVSLYKGSPIDLTWFTAEGDAFFGPETVKKIAGDIQNVHTDMIVIPDASHADIYIRTQVWERIYSDMTS
jgi:pimeloyl-ACP methyl ester carboxylesterase